MKYCLITLTWAAALLAQSSTSTTFTTDFNGNTVQASAISSVSSPGRTERTELTASINGRQVPLQQTEERVLREDSSGKTTEKIVRKYDPNGQLMSTERVLTDEQKLAGGGSKVLETTYRSDINGQMRESQRTTSETQRQGSETHTETSIERAGLDGSFQTVEKHSAVTGTAGDQTHTDETVYRRSDHGGFYPAIRLVSEERKTGDKTSNQVAFYEADVTGSLQLSRQTVSTTTKRPDGSEVTEANLYAPSVPGVIREPGAAQQLQEQQLTTRVKGPGGAVTETLVVRRPSISDPNTLGPPQKISETVCKGNCTP